MEVVFISGKYRGKTEWEVKQNIYHAEKRARMLWLQNKAVICPHLNTAFFGGSDDSIWLEGDLEILKRCDSIYMLDGWLDSKGAIVEHGVAFDNRLKIYYEDDNNFGEYDD